MDVIRVERCVYIKIAVLRESPRTTNAILTGEHSYFVVSSFKCEEKKYLPWLNPQNPHFPRVRVGRCTGNRKLVVLTILIKRSGSVFSTKHPHSMGQVLYFLLNTLTVWGSYRFVRLQLLIPYIFKIAIISWVNDTGSPVWVTEIQL